MNLWIWICLIAVFVLPALWFGVYWFRGEILRWFQR